VKRRLFTAASSRPAPPGVRRSSGSRRLAPRLLPYGDPEDEPDWEDEEDEDDPDADDDEEEEEEEEEPEWYVGPGSTA
jgi:hypothetical protein